MRQFSNNLPGRVLFEKGHAFFYFAVSGRQILKAIMGRRGAPKTVPSAVKRKGFYFGTEIS
jgi:hypothetical protein